MDPKELKAIKERNALAMSMYGSNLMTGADRDRRLLLEYVEELAREKVIAAARALAEIDQLRAQMQHALKELRE